MEIGIDFSYISTVKPFYKNTIGSTTTCCCTVKPLYNNTTGSTTTCCCISQVGAVTSTSCTETSETVPTMCVFVESVASNGPSKEVWPY